MHLLCLSSIFCIVLMLSNAAEFNGNIQTSSKYYIVGNQDGFGFLQGGTLAITLTNVQPAGTELYFLLCSEGDFYSLFGNNQPDPCSSGSLTNQSCNLVVSFNNTLKLKYSIEYYGVYYMALANCEQTDFSLNVYYLLLNPGGNQLGFGYIPLPALFVVLLSIWFLFSIIWVYNWIKNCSQRVKLHRVISLLPITEFLWCCMAEYYWSKLTAVASPSFGLEFLYGFFYVLERSVFYFVLLLIASGWDIVNDTFQMFAIGITIALAVTLFASYFLQSLFTLLTFIVYAIILVMIFRYTNRNLLDLEVEIRNRNQEIVQRGLVGQVRNQEAEKGKMFRNYRIIMTTYVCLEMLIILLEMLFLVDYYWVYEFFQEVIELMLFMCIGYTFHLRSVNIYYRLENDNMVEMNSLDSYRGSQQIQLRQQQQQQRQQQQQQRQQQLQQQEEQRQRNREIVDLPRLNTPTEVSSSEAPPYNS